MSGKTFVLRCQHSWLDSHLDRRRLVDGRLRPVCLVFRERRRDDDVVLATARPDGAVGVLERDLLVRLKVALERQGASAVLHEAVRAPDFDADVPAARAAVRPAVELRLGRPPRDGLARRVLVLVLEEDDALRERRRRARQGWVIVGVLIVAGVIDTAATATGATEGRKAIALVFEIARRAAAAAGAAVAARDRERVVAPRQAQREQLAW